MIAASQGKREDAVSAYVVAEPDAIAAAIKQRGGICRPNDDPVFAGELRSLFENAGVRVQFCRRAGMTLDAIGEMLLELSLVNRPVTIAETLDILDRVTRPRCRETLKVAAPAKTRANVNDAIRKARDMRNRKHVCDRCGQIVRGTRSTSILCGLCWEMSAATLSEDIAMLTHDPAIARAIIAAIGASIPHLRRVDPTPEELLASSDAVGAVSMGSAA